MDEPRPEFAELAKLLGADTHSFLSAKLTRRPWFSRLFSSRPLWGSAVNMALLSENYDRIYATGEDIGLRAAILLGSIGWKGEITCVVHNITNKKLKALRLAPKHMIRNFVVVSTHQAEELLRAGVPSQKIFQTYNWVDVEFFSARPVYEPHSINFVACGSENRDYATLAKACDETKLTTYVFGHGFFGPVRSGEVAASDNFRIMPRAPWLELRAFYGNATAVILPLHAVPYAAGVTGLVEAMAVGRPIIVTKSPGISEYIAHLDPRLLVEPGDHVGMAAAMRMVASDPEAFEEGARRNRAWAMSNCSLDDYAGRIAALMRA